MMMLLYLGTGALIAGFLSLYTDTTERTKPRFASKYVTACLLTAALWPLVLALAAASSKAFRTGTKLSLTKNDLISRVDPPFSDEHDHRFTLATHKGSNLPPTSSGHEVWTFKTHSRNRPLNTTIIEGYAVINNDNKIIDYIITDEYPEQLSVLH